jgi:hypothetical protein
LGEDVGDAEGAPMERVVVCEPDTLGEEEPVFELVVVAVVVGEMPALRVRATTVIEGQPVDVVEPLRDGVPELDLEAWEAE